MSPKLYDIPVEGEAHVVARIGEKALAHQWDLALDAHTRFLLKLMALAGFPAVQRDGRIRIAKFADPTNGVRTLTGQGGVPAVYVKYSNFLPSVPSRLVSGASGWSASASEIAPSLFADPKERLKLYEKHFGAVKPKAKRWTDARIGGSQATRRNTVDAIEAVLPPEHECEAELSLIEAFDQAQAVEIARSAGLPRETVAITVGGSPLVLGWHGQKPSVDEIAAYDRVVARQRADARVKLDRELRDFEQRRAEELGC